MIEDIEEIDDTIEEIDIEIPSENRKLGALALHLRGKYRCSENVVNIIFSNLKDILTDNIPKEELSTIASNYQQNIQESSTLKMLSMYQKLNLFVKMAYRDATFHLKKYLSLF